MADKKRDAYRSSETGRFVTEKFSDKHPRTTEHEKLPQPPKKGKYVPR
jgi:hypothetical protein